MKTAIHGLTGKELDEKICKAIEDSTHIQNKISTIVWNTIKQKLVWIILTLLALLLWYSLQSLATILIAKITKSS